MERRGQLKIQCFTNYGHLTLHVIQGRSLSCKRRIPCNAYIKVCLTPDHSRKARCKTDVVPNSCSPQFDEKFSFELLEEDMRKRLLISVWNKDAMTSHSEFLGCMSFGINNIVAQNKVLDGWYYLLGDELGSRKHLAVASKPLYSSGASSDGHGSIPENIYQQAPAQSRISRERLPRHVPDILQHPVVAPLTTNNLQRHESGSLHSDSIDPDVEPHVFVLKRGIFGFGFSLVGENPACVSRVEPDSPAESMGVQIGDMIIRINGINVCRSGADHVAQIVKNAEQQLILEIERTETYKNPLPQQDYDDDVYMDMYGVNRHQYTDAYGTLPNPARQSKRHYQPEQIMDPDYDSLDDDSFHAESNIYATLPSNLPTSTPYSQYQRSQGTNINKPRRKSQMDMPPPRTIPPPPKPFECHNELEDTSYQPSKNAPVRSSSVDARARSRSEDRRPRRMPQCVSGNREETKENSGKFSLFMCGGAKSSKAKQAKKT